MKPRVLVATRLYPPEVGAAAFRLEALVHGLREAGASVRVVTTKPPKGTPSGDGRAGVSRWPVLRDAGGNVRGYVQYMSFDIPLFLRLLLSRADVVVSEPPPTTGIVVALSSMVRRRPYVYYAADVWTDALIAIRAPAVVVRCMRFLEGQALRKASRVIAISEGVADQIAAFDVDPGRLTVVNNGVDTTVFSRDGGSVSTDYPYFVYTGTMSEWQGADIFIEAIALVADEFPTVRLHFFGQGSAEEALRRLATTVAPGKVSFGGVIQPAEAARWIRGAAAAVVSIVPEQGYDFAKPTKIYAAAACGTPVIYAGGGECSRMVSDNGLGVSSDFSAEAVAEKMIHLLQGSDSGRAARSDWVERNASLRVTGQRAAAEVLRTAS
ncbi:glycosyltransferase family 4 protein [Arthrobacter sp. H20]|uniref:glycosyltransferase family 4 protein n=1 Tax=Arthrobacter sp. H20 TaxID=1267981 RepID=UPI0004B6A569|nr:glycosyltransferase family 4 protein [Arthrobacter sp. H20]